MSTREMVAFKGPVSFVVLSRLLYDLWERRYICKNKYTICEEPILTVYLKRVFQLTKQLTKKNIYKWKITGILLKVLKTFWKTSNFFIFYSLSAARNQRWLYLSRSTWKPTLLTLRNVSTQISLCSPRRHIPSRREGGIE